MLQMQVVGGFLNAPLEDMPELPKCTERRKERAWDVTHWGKVALANECDDNGDQKEDCHNLSKARVSEEPEAHSGNRLCRHN